MASLYITEYAQIGPSGAQAPLEPPLAEQKLTIGSEVDSAALNPNTRLVRLHCDAICSILFGTAPTAAVTKQRMAADQTEYKCVEAGAGTLLISVIANT